MRAHCHRNNDGVTRALWNTLRDGRPRKTTMAKELHRLAGVPEGPCGIQELQMFQDALGTEYQLVVMCMSFIRFSDEADAQMVCRSF